MQRTALVHEGGLPWAVAGLLLATACQSAPPVASSPSELYTGDPPPSFVLRKFAPRAGPMERTSAVEREPGEFPSIDAGPFLLKELAVKSLAVSNQDIDAALQTLAAIGYETIVTTAGAALQEQGELEFTADQLPVVMLNRNKDDARFLKSVIAREMIRLNGGLEEIKIRDLRVGRYVALPDLGEGKEFDVDLETLRTYENSKNYEKVVFASLEEAFRRIDEDVEREASSSPR